ncbi:MAG: Xaa-Pro peptidase family protein [Paludisphaera borealis]|uniref:Xaa-Pro peptidase family protein n=1 Tax=Paludisphaera borealis TaxID=1387353 RepID=UPI00283C44F0|nr:Xaa-Pro peptidase family protein [Paludisphaera borealis]MDR3622948.1 Xaa-Pro peptidase family protein [Paludisphaera borealis]
MLTREGCLARRRRLWEATSGTVDAIVITQPESLVYFAGFRASPFTFRSSESSAALILLPDRAILIADDLLDPYLAESHVDATAAFSWYAGERPAPHRGDRLVEAFTEAWPRTAGSRLGVEYASIPAGILDGVSGVSDDQTFEVSNIDPIVRELRRAKDADELALLRRSARAGEAAHAAALDRMRPGMTELDAFLIVQEAAVREAGEPVQVYGDFVASGGPDAIEPPHTPRLRNRPIQAGELLLLDFSVVVHGYRADFTNTFVVGGEPTARQRAMADACLGALAAGEALLGPDREARAIDAAVRGYFASLKLDSYFQSHSGHGLGLGHPEPPFLVPDSDETLAVGDVVALEPSINAPDVGLMRFERNYLITENGCELLTRHRLTLTP